MNSIVASLVEFGAETSSLHLFEKDGPELLPYATLVAAQRGGDSVLTLLGAVYEWQGAPLVFLVEADALDNDAQLHRLRRLLAMRGDAPYLGVIAPGRLDVYRIALDEKSLREARINVSRGSSPKVGLLAHLANERPGAAINHRNWISNVVLNLLTGSITRLISETGISDEDAISLVGRALFTRFLADRNLLPPTMAHAADPANLFDDQKSSEKTSKWLDQTFNGDLLPLSTGLFDGLAPAAYTVLGDILRRAPDGQLFLGWEEKWNHLDFAHIPVGVLSQAYELYLRRHAPLKQRREGGYYTPRSIADLMTRASFRALERRSVAHEAKVLDPAAGAGVFLLTAFRELVASRWRFDRRRPETAMLRSILYEQIVGFDINEAALRFAALGLYLISIELDPDPKPIDKLRFEDLRGRVLFMARLETEERGSDLGSLGPAIGHEHRNRYDLVLGNPPWASGTKLNDWDLVCSRVREIASGRGASVQTPLLPNEVLDLPFVWRAMEWAKSDGQIAFALHARLLFQQGDGMTEARRALFEALDVTSVINGVELRQTKVWPEISAPFCILLATNRSPGVTAGFRLISPRIEESLNAAGGLRVDATNAEVVSSHRLEGTPDLLKILFRGSTADLGIIERIRSHGYPTLSSLWTECGDEQAVNSGNGYQKLRPSSRIRLNGDGKPGVDAGYLRNLPEITATSFSGIVLETEDLAYFSHDRIHDPRSVELFQGPLLLIHKSPPAVNGRIAVSVSDSPVVYNETFYGYSARGHSGGATLVRYLALIFGSKLAVWMALLTSGEFGFEREVIEKATLDRMALPDFRELTKAQHREVHDLISGLGDGTASWNDADGWVAARYGLGSRDLQVISDTLEFNLPFAVNKRKAQEVPSVEDRQRFCEVLDSELEPWGSRLGISIRATSLEEAIFPPWYGISIGVGKPQPKSSVSNSDWEGLLRSADEAAASELILRSGKKRLLIGKLSQKRYWSDTQARLLAQRVVWGHLEAFKGRK